MISDESQNFVPTIPDNIQIQTAVAPIQTWVSDGNEISVNSDKWEDKLPIVNDEDCIQLIDGFENEINTTIEWFDGYMVGINGL